MPSAHGKVPVEPPSGFVVLGFCLGVYALGCTGSIVLNPSWARGTPWPITLLELVSVVLAAVAAEALWMMRPWAARAVGALAALAFATKVVLVGTGAGFYPGALVRVAVTGGVMGLIVRYVHGHVHARYGPTVILQRRRRVPWRP